MTLLLLIGSVLVLIWCYLSIKPAMRQVGPFLPDSYLFGIGLYTVGAILVFLTHPGPDSIEIAAISLVAMTSALLGAVLFVFMCGSFYKPVDFHRQFSGTDSGQIEQFSIKAMLLLSGIVCIAFVYAVFSNSIIGALLSIASLAGDSTLLDARKAITAGSAGYLAPGYVKQFRDIIIPIAIMATMVITPGFRRSPVVWFGFGTAIIAMLVSGQRLVFVIFFVALLLASYYTSQFAGRRRRVDAGRRRVPWLAIVLLLVAYGLLTVLLGRVNPDLSPFGLIAEISVNLFDRILLAAPQENLLTFEVWQNIGPTYGESWLADLGGILPGVRESLSNILHSATGGSIHGNSPLGLPADVWLAWGWAGLILIPFLYAFAIGLLDMLLLANRSAIFFAVKIYLFVILPICYSPYLFILYGGAVALILITFSEILRSKPWWRASAAEV